MKTLNEFINNSINEGFFFTNKVDISKELLEILFDDSVSDDVDIEDEAENQAQAIYNYAKKLGKTKATWYVPKNVKEQAEIDLKDYSDKKEYKTLENFIKNLEILDDKKFYKNAYEIVKTGKNIYRGKMYAKDNIIIHCLYSSPNAENSYHAEDDIIAQVIIKLK